MIQIWQVRLECGPSNLVVLVLVLRISKNWHILTPLPPLQVLTLYMNGPLKGSNDQTRMLAIICPIIQIVPD